MFSKIREGGLKMRLAFRASIYLLALVVYLVFVAISYNNVSSDELERATHSMQSEANYLCLQLESLTKRSEAFQRILATSGTSANQMAAADPSDYRLLSDPVGDVLTGYTLQETGTVAILANGSVVTSDDERIPAGSEIADLIGSEASTAIERSVAGGQLQLVPLEGALGGQEADGYLLAAQQGPYTILIIEPADMVFRDRSQAMIRVTTVAALMILASLVIVDLLLTRVIARRIDATNEALAEITSGQLDVTVEEAGFREFRSLARGINVTVDALKGWIAEAKSRLDKELAIARAIQKSQLPSTFPPFPDIARFDIYASMDPAREVGGDFYDFFLVGEGCTPDEGKLAFVVADVSSKSVPAALFMMKAKALIREYLLDEQDPGVAMAEANRTILEGNDANMFVTAWVGVLDYATGRIEYVNAGHNPPLLRHEGSWDWIPDKSGPVLGVFEADFQVHSIDCVPGDTLLLYTDGVTEAFSVQEELYGEERLLAFLSSRGDEDAHGLVRAVRADVAAFAQGAEQSDDITVMALDLGPRDQSSR